MFDCELCTVVDSIESLSNVDLDEKEYDGVLLECTIFIWVDTL